LSFPNAFYRNGDDEMSYGLSCLDLCKPWAAFVSLEWSNYLLCCVMHKT